MESHRILTKMILASVIVNLVIGFMAYFSVLISGTNSGAFATFQSISAQLQNAQTNFASSVSVIFQPSQGIVTIAINLILALFNLLAFIFIGLVMVIYMFIAFLPSLIAYAIGGTIGSVLGSISLAISIISVIYLAYTIREWIK